MPRLTSASQRHWLFALYGISVLVVTVQRGVFQFPNDYAIFRASFWNLLQGRDLYVLYLDQAHDVFKYSPTFAALFAPLSLLQFTVGLLVWNALGALLLIHAVMRLLPENDANLVLALTYLPMLRNVQSAQSNTLVAALIVLAFVALEREKRWRGSLIVGAAAAIKIFPLAALSFAIPHRRRLRFAGWFILAATALLALPLLFTPYRLLVEQYRSWGMLQRREIQDYGASVMGIAHTWFGRNWPAWTLQIAGTAILLFPLAYRPAAWEHAPDLRLRLLCSVLVYCVIFNHKAETQSYVIALTGIAIWYTTSRRGPWRTALMAVVLFLTFGLSPVPDVIKSGLTPLMRRPLPTSIVWLVMQVELIAAIRSSHPLRVRRRVVQRAEINEFDPAATEPGT